VHRAGAISGELLEHPIHTTWLQRLSLGGRIYRPLLSLMPQAIESFTFEGFDLIISSSHCVAKGVIPPPGAVHVSYCHTPMRYLWDQRNEYVRRMSPLARMVFRRRLEQLRTWDVVSSARVDHFVANSHLVARRIERYWRREAEVIPPPVEIDFFTPAGSAGAAPGDVPGPTQAGPRDFIPEVASGRSVNGSILIVAALVPYKRVDVGIEVAKRLGLRVHVIGDGPMRGALERSAPPSVEFYSRVSRERLRDEYRDAAFLLVPNVEDFGMVTVEALACGTPVVGLVGSGTADVVVPGEHGALAADSSVDSIVAACREVLARPWDPGALRHRAESFSSQRFRRRFAYLLERVLPPKPPA